MLFEEPQTGTNNLGLIIKPAARNTLVNQLLKVRRDDFAHSTSVQ